MRHHLITKGSGVRETALVFGRIYGCATRCSFVGFCRRPFLKRTGEGLWLIGRDSGEPGRTRLAFWFHFIHSKKAETKDFNAINKNKIQLHQNQIHELLKKVYYYGLTSSQAYRRSKPTICAGDLVVEHPKGNSTQTISMKNTNEVVDKSHGSVIWKRRQPAVVRENAN